MLSIATDEYNKFHSKVMVDSLLAQNLDLVSLFLLFQHDTNSVKYVFEDVTYKDNCPVPIIEESQKLIVARMLTQAGKKVLIRDSSIIIKEVQKEYGNIFQYEIKRTEA